MCKRKNQEIENSTRKKPRTSEKALRFVSHHDREHTRKYIAKVKAGEEREILLDFEKEDYLSTIKNSNDKEGHFHALKHDKGCLKHVMTPDGKKTGKPL